RYQGVRARPRRRVRGNRRVPGDEVRGLRRLRKFPQGRAARQISRRKAARQARSWQDRVMVTLTAAQQRLRDLALLRRVRDRIDREYAQPLNVEALAREVGMSAGHLSRQFRTAYGEPPYSYLMTRRVERAMTLLSGDA